MKKAGQSPAPLWRSHSIGGRPWNPTSTFRRETIGRSMPVFRRSPSRPTKMAGGAVRPCQRTQSKRRAFWFYVSHPDHVSDSRGYSRRLTLKTARAMTEAFMLRSGVQISGQAHDAHGKAVSGATVVLAYSANSGDFLRTKTDQAGRFLFAHADDKPTLGRFCLSVEAVGFSPAWKMLVPGDAIPVLDFELAPGRPFSGQVVDSQGTPVAGGPTSSRDGRSVTYSTGKPRLTARADSSGSAPDGGGN